MSDDEDPFEQFEDVSDRDGDPFERLGDADEGSDGDTDDDGGTADTDDHSGWDGDPLGGSNGTGDGSASETTDGPRYDAHDTTPADHADGLPDGVSDREDESGDDGDGVVEMDEPEIDTGTDDPFGDVGKRTGDPFEDDVFEEMDIEELDPDEVWASIADAEERGSVSQQAERIYAEVSKHRFCEQCEFFSKPPDVACSHEGTEILEFLDQETVRLVDCPVVAERKELEKHD
jgi:hypothetical protein